MWLVVTSARWPAYMGNGTMTIAHGDDNHVEKESNEQGLATDGGKVQVGGT